jgi:hypothetical protein
MRFVTEARYFREVGPISDFEMVLTFQTTDCFVVHQEGRPYQFTALIVRAFEVKGK